MSYFFFFNDTAPTEIYTLSLHDALPIYDDDLRGDLTRTTNRLHALLATYWPRLEQTLDKQLASAQIGRDTSELQSHVNLVCRLLLEKKKKKTQNTTY